MKSLGRRWKTFIRKLNVLEVSLTANGAPRRRRRRLHLSKQSTRAYDASGVLRLARLARSAAALAPHSWAVVASH
eukprot:SAG31_NODE_38778_length_293_cov_1.061856_1_plen_74_part_10